MAKESLITKIEGYKCNVCRAEMTGVSQKEALAHARVPVDKPFQRGFAYVAYTDDYTGKTKVNVIIDGGRIDKVTEARGVHGYMQGVQGYSIDKKGVSAPERGRDINTKSVRDNIKQGFSRLLTEEELGRIDEAHYRVYSLHVMREDPSLKLTRKKKK